MKVLNNISESINNITRLVIIICFSVMIVAYFGQIVLRYGLGTGLRWTEELTRYTNILMVMLGSAILAGYKGHINVSILELLVPEKHRKWAYIFQQLATIIFFGIAIVIGFNMMKLAGTQVSTNLRIPMKYVYALFPLSYVILVYQSVVYVLNLLLNTDKKESA